MLESFGLQVLFKLVCIILGVVCARACLIWMDSKLVPKEFKEMINEMDNTSKALYYGLRVVGICLMVGLALS